MTYCNVNQYFAKKLTKIRNIMSFDQVEKTFKFSAYLAWDNVDFSQEEVKPIGQVTHPSTFRSIGGKGRSKCKSLRERYTSTSNSGQMASENDFDIILIPTIGCNNSKDLTVNPNDVVANKNAVDKWWFYNPFWF